MGMDYIRTTYGVPAKRGGRVAYGCEGIGLRTGTIVGSRGGYLRIRLDGEKVARNFHPEWNIAYLTPNVEVRGDAPLYGAASLSTAGLGGCRPGERELKC